MLAPAAAVPEKKNARRAEGRIGVLTHVGSETVDFFRSTGEILAFIGAIQLKLWPLFPLETVHRFRCFVTTH